MRTPELRELSLVGIPLILIAAGTGCSSSNENEEFFRTSAQLLEIDKSWTDITTYQEKVSGLPDIGSEVDFGSRRQLNGFIRSNSETLVKIRFEQELLAVAAELSGIRQAMSTLYEEELSAWNSGGYRTDWRPQQNYRNAADYVDQYGPIGKFGKSFLDEYYLGPWLEAQLRRATIYERWLTLIEEMGADATTIAEYETAMDKQ